MSSQASKIDTDKVGVGNVNYNVYNIVGIKWRNSNIVILKKFNILIKRFLVLFKR